MQVGDLVTNKHTGDLAVVLGTKSGGLGTVYLIHHFILNHECWLSIEEVEVIDESR